MALFICNYLVLMSLIDGVREANVKENGWKNIKEDIIISFFYLFLRNNQILFQELKGLDKGCCKNIIQIEGSQWYKG